MFNSNFIYLLLSFIVFYCYFFIIIFRLGFFFVLLSAPIISTSINATHISVDYTNFLSAISIERTRRSHTPTFIRLPLTHTYLHTYTLSRVYLNMPHSCVGVERKVWPLDGNWNGTKSEREMCAAKLCGSFVLCEGHVSRSRSSVRCVIGNSHLFIFMCVRVYMRALSLH